MDGDNAADQSLPLDLRSLKALSVLGRGAKGVAFLVRHRDETLALKTISKSSIEKKNSEDGYRRIRFERDTLKELRHPLLPQLRGFLATEKIVGFAIEYCSGGDLNSLRKKQTEKSFSDDIIRFYAAELVLALEYLHGLGIVYRDLKPENVLIQQDGHLMLVDFDLSKKLSANKPLQNKPIPSESDKSATRNRFPSFCFCEGGFPEKNSVNATRSDGAESNLLNSGESGSGSGSKSNSFVGTQDYVAPEMITGNGHDFSVDWWSLGVLLYEMLYGETPFKGSDRKETFYRILTKKPDLVGDPTPLRDLIGRLLEKDPEKRISLEGIKGHEFFRGVVWENVVGICRPPFIPGGREEEMMGEGKLGIDVEDFVERVFSDCDGEVVGKEKDFGKKDGGKKGVWVDALRESTWDSGDLLVF